MRILFQDLGRLHRSIEGELRQAFDGVMASSRFVGDTASRDFEIVFAEAHNRRHAVGCGSGTDALTLSLLAAGVRPDSEVILPSMTFVATAEAVVHARAVPVVADVDPTSLLLTRETVDPLITERTSAVMPVHLYGHVVEPSAMRAWREQGLIVIEDAAQAHLATRDDRVVGSFGNAAGFSFYPGKNLGALGDGGAIVTDDDEVAARLVNLRDHGRSDKYRHDVVGFCSRLDGIQAALLAVKLRHLPDWTDSRRRLASRYRERLPTGLLVPWEEGAVHHLVVVRVPAGRRQAIAAELDNRGIQTGVHYPIPLSRQPALSEWAKPTPVAEKAADEVLSLPMDPLMTDDEVDEVVEALIDLLE